MLTRRKLLGKQTWYSICSKHREYNDTCDLCKVGDWHTDWVLWISSKLYKSFPKQWIYIKNIKLGKG